MDSLGTFFEIKYGIISYKIIPQLYKLGTFFEIKYGIIFLGCRSFDFRLGTFFEIKYGIILNLYLKYILFVRDVL